MGKVFVYLLAALLVVSSVRSAFFASGGRSSAAESVPVLVQAAVGAARFILLPRFLRRR